METNNYQMRMGDYSPAKLPLSRPNGNPVAFSDDPFFLCAVSFKKLDHPPWRRMHRSSLPIGRLLGTWNTLRSVAALLRPYL